MRATTTGTSKRSRATRAAIMLLLSAACTRGERVGAFYAGFDERIPIEDLTSQPAALIPSNSSKTSGFRSTTATV